MLKLLILLLIAVTYLPKSLSSNQDKILIKEQQSREEKVLKLLSKVGTEDDFEFVRKPFPFIDPTLFTNGEALKNFTAYYNQGFLDKNGVFLPYDHKTYRDTASLTDLFYFAKDFDIFYKIALWAKSEINPVQYVYSLISALLHRNDLSYIKVPPIYEILPNYFVPSSVMNAAYRARLNGVDYRKFVINNTGWERGSKIHYDYDFYHGEIDKFDYESRLSYYREDVSRSEFFFKYFKKMDIAMNDERKYGRHLERLEEWYYTAFKWILTRYNLERYAVDLPPVRPFNLENNINVKGYDSQLSDLYGHQFSSRPDNIKPFDINPEGIVIMEKFVNMYLTGAYKKHFKTSRMNSNPRISNKRSDPMTESTISIPPYYFGLMSLVDRLSSAFNNKFTQGILLNDLTRMRDPAYYQILALINELVRSTESESESYSKQELGFPGVKITDIKIEKLETYFEYFDFDISNVIPGKGGKFLASQFRINHKPFKVKIHVKSEVESIGIIKIFLGPKTNVLNRTLSLNELRQSFTLMDTFEVRLKTGNNVIERRPSKSELTSEPFHFDDIKGRTNDDPRNSQLQCYYPSHLMLPKGVPYGKPYQLFFIIYPSLKSVSTNQGCGREHLTLDTTRSLPFPVDRPWNPASMKQANLKFVDILIYHSDQ